MTARKKTEKKSSGERASNGTELIKTIVPEDLKLKETQKKEISDDNFAQYIRVLLQNWRQGTVGCKDRSEVNLTGKKPWKQKGTGRARAGTARSPLWRKGGVIFGPQMRTRKLTIPKKMKLQVNNAFLWDYLLSNKIFSLNWEPSGEKPKTAQAFQVLKKTGLADKKIVLFVSNDDWITHASFANIPNVRMLIFDQPNAYNLIDSQCWVFLNKDLENFKEMVSLWI